MLPLPTDRLFFRPWRDDDGPLADALWGDARVTAKLGVIVPRERLARELATQRDHGVSYWPIGLRATNAPVGCCGLRPYVDDVLELGFHLLPACWGAGYATEAARAVIEAARANGVRALFAGHHPENAASRRTLEKLGFAYTHDEPYAATGLLHPSYRLEL